MLSFDKDHKGRVDLRRRWGSRVLPSHLLCTMKGQMGGPMGGGGWCEWGASSVPVYKCKINIMYIGTCTLLTSVAGHSSEVERSLMVRWVVGSILHGVDPLSYFSFQPVHRTMSERFYHGATSRSFTLPSQNKLDSSCTVLREKYIDGINLI